MKISLQVMRSPNFKKIKRSIDKRFRKSKQEIAEDISDYIFRRVIKNVSKKDFSLIQLAEMDHPYARRHGSIQTSKLGSMRSYQIHTRSGGLRSAINMDKRGSNQFQEQFNIRLTPTKEYQKAVFYGSKIMIGRDVLRGTMQEPDIQAKIRRARKEKMKSNFG